MGGGIIPYPHTPVVKCSRNDKFRLGPTRTTLVDHHLHYTEVEVNA